MADTNGDWYKAFRKQQICPECRHRKREFVSQPVDIVLDDEPGDYPFLEASCIPAEIGKRSLLERFANAAEGYLLLGRVLHKDGREFEDLVSFTAPYALPIRGGPKSFRKWCGTCGGLRYIPEPIDYCYIVASDLRPGRRLYMGHPFYSLVVTGDLLDRIDARTRKRLWVDELPVREKGEDGIEDFPTVYP